ncbi:MAG: hypothetical protein PHF84_07955 [bacterium]|nr:hypothetical protein [bacterium]
MSVDISNTFIKFIAKYFELDNLAVRWKAITNLGKGKNLEIPKSILGINVDLLSRSYYNANAIQPNLDWVLPYWVVKQFDPASRSFMPSNYLTVNLTHRNWTGFSSLDSDFEAIIDPRALLTPLFDSWSVDFWVKKGDYIIIPSKLEKMSQHLVNKLPIIKSVFYKKGLEVTSECLMHSEEHQQFILANYLVENPESNSLDISFYISVRPYNPEGIVPVFKIEYLEKENAFRINGKDHVYLQEKPRRVVCSNQNKGDAFFYVNKPTGEEAHRSEDSSGLCTAFAEYTVRLPHANFFSTNVIIPVSNNQVSIIKELFSQKFHRIRNRNINLWEEKKKDSLQVQTPDSRVNEALESSKSNLLVLLDKEAIPPGPFTYHTMWFRDAAYSVTALLKLGFSQDVKRILGYYFAKQQPDGYFLSQQGEWDSNGQVLWTMAQYYRFTNDLDFIKEHYGSLQKAVEWIFRQTGKNPAHPESPEYGLLPSGFSAEHFGPSNYYYWDNFWSYAGIREFIALSKVLGRNVSAMEKDNERYWHNIEDSIRKYQIRTDEKFIPSSPFRTDDSSMIGSVVALYPLQIMDPDREDMNNTLKLIRKKYMHHGAFFHKLIHSGYNVYLTAHVAECYLMRKSTFIMPILEWILENASDTFTFPEAIHPETKGGCMGDGHHGWATSEVIHFIRNMLFYENGGKLIFFPVIPHHWLDLNNCLSVKNASSHFGKCDFSLTSTEQYIEFSFRSEFHHVPEKLEINLPVMIEKIVVDGREQPVNAKSFEIDHRKELNIRMFI